MFLLSGYHRNGRKKFFFKEKTHDQGFPQTTEFSTDYREVESHRRHTKPAAGWHPQTRLLLRQGWKVCSMKNIKFFPAGARFGGGIPALYLYWLFELTVCIFLYIPVKKCRKQVPFCYLDALTHTVNTIKLKRKLHF